MQAYIIWMLLVSEPPETKSQSGSPSCFWTYHVLCAREKNNCFAINPRNDRCYTLINSLGVLSTCTIDMCLANSDCADCRNFSAGQEITRPKCTDVCFVCTEAPALLAVCKLPVRANHRQPPHSFSARVHLYLPAELVLVCEAPLINLFSRFCGKHIYWPNCTWEYKM